MLPCRPDSAGTGVVRERYWLSFQPGEIRVCTSCHGLNSKDQAGQSTPTNPRNREGDEMYNKRVFHELCIGCHQASNAKTDSRCKAPVACTECHEPGTGVPRTVSD